MRSRQRTSASIKGIVFALALASLSALIAFVNQDTNPQITAQAPDKIEATIFAYDGHDFIRAKTTLRTKDGKSAVNTKLDHSSAAYKALVSTTTLRRIRP